MLGRRFAVVLVFAFALIPFLGSGSVAHAANLLRVVTYNVAGLPEGMSRSHPLRNLPLIGKRLNAYDLAFVQEDFAYPSLLRQFLGLSHQSKPFVRGDRYHFGDGLSLFSRLPFAEPSRTAWAECHGVTDSFFDCLTPKGLLRTSVELSPGLALDVYDVHLDAGWSSGDRLARAAQLDQLTHAIRSQSAERAVLVAGDFNLSQSELDALDRLEREVGLRDACRALGCPEPRRIDRILFRSSAELALVPAAWRVDRGFVDSNGRPLSDHAPVAVTFRWTARRSITSQAAR